MRRVDPSKRLFLRRFPAPPSTPDGMVWNEAGQLEPAEATQKRCRERMENFDELTPALRRQLANS